MDVRFKWRITVLVPYYLVFRRMHLREHTPIASILWWVLIYFSVQQTRKWAGNNAKNDSFLQKTTTGPWVQHLHQGWILNIKTFSTQLLNDTCSTACLKMIFTDQCSTVVDIALVAQKRSNTKYSLKGVEMELASENHDTVCSPYCGGESRKKSIHNPRLGRSNKFSIAMWNQRCWFCMVKSDCFMFGGDGIKNNSIPNHK